MHDTDNHYFDVRTWCDRQILYVEEIGTRVLFTSIMCKVRDGIQQNYKQYKLDITHNMQPHIIVPS